MIINPIALATKGFIGNDLNITLATKGDIDIRASGGVVDPGGYVGFVRNLKDEEELMIIIQSFLHVRGR
jgi:hypothetical protein